MLERYFTIFFIYCQGLLIIYYYTSNRENYDIEIFLISYKLELGLQGESVDGQEAIESSSIDQLFVEIWEVYREYAQQCSLFFTIKLDSNHANHIIMYNNELQQSVQT